MEFTEQELGAIRSTFCKGFTDDQFQVCLTFCRVRNLLPGKHVVFQLRQSNEWDEILRAKQKVTKIIFITTIDASRLIAQRTGQYGGQAPEQYIYLDEDGTPSIVSEIPLPQMPLPLKGQAALPREPWAVRTTVFRKDFQQPITSVARFDAYAATYSTNDGIKLSDMWAKRGPEQLAKCSEMLSLRRGFPEELGGLYIAEEFKAENEEPTTPVTPASVVPLPPTAPKVDQTPAIPTDAPRPGEKPVRFHTNVSEAGDILETPEVKVEHHVTVVPATLLEHAGPILVVKEPEPVPEKPKRGRKPKEQPSPVNGRDIAAEGGITDADTELVGTPTPVEIDQAPAAEEFVASLDPTPTKEEMVGFTTRVRALTAKGRKSDEIKAHVLKVGGVADTKLVTVGAWKKALDELENPKPAEGEFK